MADAATAPLRKNRNFQALLAAQTTSALGDAFSYVAVPLLILHTTGSVLQMGVVTGLVGAASMVTGVFAGVIADRFNRRTLLRICDVARCLIYASIPVAWAVAGPQLWLLYLVLPLAGAFSMVFQVTYVTIVPSLVPPEQITAANGRLYGTFSTAYLVGPALAGLISSQFGPSVAIAVDAATFAVSAVGIGFIHLPPADVDAEKERDATASFLVGVRFVWRHPVLRPLTALLTVLTFFTFGLTDVIVFHLKEDLRQPDSVIGYVMTAGIIGTLLASAVVSRVRRRVGFGVSWIAAYCLCGGAIAGIGIATSVSVVAILATTVLLATGIAGISSMSLRQEVTPSHMLGRVTSAFWTLHSSLAPIGAAALTAAAAQFGVGPTLAVTGVACVITTLSAALTPILRAKPDVADGERLVGEPT